MNEIKSFWCINDISVTMLGYKTALYELNWYFKAISLNKKTLIGCSLVYEAVKQYRYNNVLILKLYEFDLPYILVYADFAYY